MTDRRELEGSLLAEISRRMKEISETQHELARRQRILTRAATLLRTGKGAEPVLAEIREQDPDLLRDYCDLHLTVKPPPLRTVPRAAASAWRRELPGEAAARQPRPGRAPAPTPAGSASGSAPP